MEDAGNPTVSTSLPVRNARNARAARRAQRPLLKDRKSLATRATRTTRTMRPIRSSLACSREGQAWSILCLTEGPPGPENLFDSNVSILISLSKRKLLGAQIRICVQQKDLLETLPEIPSTVASRPASSGWRPWWKCQGSPEAQSAQPRWSLK